VRPLGAFEELFWLFDQNRPFHFTMAAEIEGHTTIAEWRRAFDSLQKRHPFFAVYIEKNECRVPNFRRDVSAAIPFRVVQGANVTKRRESEVELELSIPFNAGEAPLLRAALLHEEERAVCIFAIHHSISDGRSMAFVIRDLLQSLAGKALDPLPVLPSMEDILGVTSPDFVPPETAAQPPTEKPLVYADKEKPGPRIKSLELTRELTNKLRDRARAEGTTVHGALCAAFALAYWELNDELKEEPVRIVSPIDLRKMLGVGENNTLLVGAGAVAIDPDPSTTFWEIASGSTARLAPAQTLEATRAAKYSVHQMVKQGMDVSAAAAFAAQAFAHEIVITNLGNLAYDTDFGRLRLEAVWGPAASVRAVGRPAIGVTTANGVLRLLQTTMEEPGLLLETAEDMLVSACATKKHVLLADLQV
jgi:NRPS condensation-like uncharacterized protein